MVIGFINAGLLNLAQAVGIIIGTNIGTTITAQIVSFDVSVLAMPAIIIGLLLYFVTWKGIRGFGETVLGFGFLFFGMVIMSDELTGIGSFPSVERLFSHFDCTPADGVMPFGAVMGALAIGLIVTMIIQSSSASTGIVIALGASGLVNFYTAIPLILGANIGTTVTAQLAAITANRVAKQAALAHTLFNVFGTILMLVFFYVPWGRSGIPVFYYIVDAMTGGDAFAAIPQNVPRHIANAHTLFNVFTAIILLPFVPQLARLCEKIIPAGRRKVKYVSLDPHLLENPAIALQQSVLQLRTMVRNSWQLLDRTMHDDIFDGRIDNAKREDVEPPRGQDRPDAVRNHRLSGAVDAAAAFTGGVAAGSGGDPLHQRCGTAGGLRGEHHHPVGTAVGIQAETDEEVGKRPENAVQPDFRHGPPR